MLHLTKLAVVFSLFLAFGMIQFAFAENPTPYNEWDFDILEINVSQDNNNPEYMIISIPVIYKGDFELGTVNIEAKVTDPNGNSYPHRGQIRDMEIGQISTHEYRYKMSFDGTHKINISLTPPEKPYLSHIFDTDYTELEIKPNGLLRQYGTISDEFDKMVVYSLEKPHLVNYDEVVNAKINLPDNHNYEKIALVNGKFVKEYSTDTKDIYIKSSNYSDMKVKLVEEGNLLPLADAQDTFQEYVVFYAMDKSQCANTFCVNIDLVEEPEEFPLWIVGIIAVVVVVVIAMILMRNKTQTVDSYFHPDTQ